MPKPIPVASATLALAAGFALAQPFAPAGAGGGTDLAFVEKVVDYTEINLGEPGIGLGDRFAYRSEFLDDDDQVAGVGAGECVVVTPKQDGFGVTNCVGYIDLPGGQLTIAGLWDVTEETGAVAVTGGTGDYADVGGTLEFTQTGEDTFRDEIHLIR